MVTKMAAPPSIAVGRLCQRSDFGLATKPYFLASANGECQQRRKHEACNTRSKCGCRVGNIRKTGLFFFYFPCSRLFV